MESGKEYCSAPQLESASLWLTLYGTSAERRPQSTAYRSVLYDQEGFRPDPMDCRAKDGNHVGIHTHCHVPCPGACHGSSTKRVQIHQQAGYRNRTRCRVDGALKLSEHIELWLNWLMSRGLDVSEKRGVYFTVLRAISRATMRNIMEIQGLNDMRTTGDIR